MKVDMKDQYFEHERVHEADNLERKLIIGNTLVSSAMDTCYERLNMQHWLGKVFYKDEEADFDEKCQLMIPEEAST